ncbi:hypothetical protein EXIGLDRAFT_830387 [Exidia glandulosa HHB12029]|uniref:Transmembrane protein n=1 Tax=Exidia glandulosa HHB12029 TaxID=1314781 RepID=A0A165NMK5_EXIGL|nr:hypothetical protein EXIGLDRAFT_830387 [Exidia glandulosa HHB12029]
MRRRQKQIGPENTAAGAGWLQYYPAQVQDQGSPKVRQSPATIRAWPDLGILHSARDFRNAINSTPPRNSNVPPSRPPLSILLAVLGDDELDENDDERGHHVHLGRSARALQRRHAPRHAPSSLPLYVSVSLTSSDPGLSICTWCFARRTASEDFFSSRGRAGITFAKWCLLLVFLDSWIFMALSGLLINGIGLSVSPAACELAIISCIAFYAASKFLIYTFLIEKVYIVWSAGSSLRRFQTPVYRVCALVLAAYAAVICLMVMFRLSQLSLGDGRCVIGLKRTASIVVLSYDLFVNFWLTGLFLWPLTRTTTHNARLRRVTLRTLIAAAAALTTSTVNIVILAICDGQEVGWVCLASCGADVTVNAIVLFWVTASPSSSTGFDTVPILKTIDDEEKGYGGGPSEGPFFPPPMRFPRPYPNTPSLPSTGWELETAHTASTVSMKFAPPSAPIQIPVALHSPGSSTRKLAITIPSRTPSSPGGVQSSSPLSLSGSPSVSRTPSHSLKRTRSGALIHVPSTVREPPASTDAAATLSRPAPPSRSFTWSPSSPAPASSSSPVTPPSFPRGSSAPPQLTSTKWSRVLWFGPSSSSSGSSSPGGRPPKKPPPAVTLTDLPPRARRPVRYRHRDRNSDSEDSQASHHHHHQRHSLTLPPQQQIVSLQAVARTHSLPLQQQHTPTHTHTSSKFRIFA